MRKVTWFWNGRGVLRKIKNEIGKWISAMGVNQNVLPPGRVTTRLSETTLSC